MDEEEKERAADEAGGLGQELRKALLDALTPDDLALIAEARAARDRGGEKKAKKQGKQKERWDDG